MRLRNQLRDSLQRGNITLRKFMRTQGSLTSKLDRSLRNKLRAERERQQQTVDGGEEILRSVLESVSSEQRYKNI